MDGNDLKVKEITIADEMEDLLLKDLLEAGYQGEELRAKFLERKNMKSIYPKVQLETSKKWNPL